MQGVRKLIFPVSGESGTVRYYLHIDELFDELEEVHSKLGHGGRDKMERKVRPLFKNVSRKTVLDFLVGCENCETKKGKKRKGLVVSPLPIFHSYINATAVNSISLICR